MAEVPSAPRGRRVPEAVATDRFIARLRLRDGIKVSRGTLYNWHRKLKAGGPGALVDGRGVDYAGRRNPYPFLRMLRRLYALSPGQPDLRRCYEQACRLAERRGWPVKSLTTARRYLFQ